MSKVTVGYLSYITEKNKKSRFDDFSKSLESLCILRSHNVNLLSIDNSSIDDAKNILRNSKIFSRLFHYKKNYFDISLFYTAIWEAERNKSEYVCFLYDDFIVYDNAFEDIIHFMDSNQNVSCTRITAYDFDKKDLYDADKTPKSKNPDSVRHYNSVTGQKLAWSNPYSIGNHRFFINNWHYTSRPTVWRTSFISKILDLQQIDSFVLQGFEKWATEKFQSNGLVTGVLDIGMVRTTPIEKSARGIEISPSREVSIKVSIPELREEFIELGR